MRPAAHDHSPPAPYFTRLSGSERGYAELLEAHRAACALGHPLLTDAGVSFLCDRLLPPGIVRPVLTSGTPYPGDLADEDLLPYWDAEARQLWLGGHLLKEFRQPAGSQTTLLAVFQEQGWAAHIDDPLAPTADEGQDDAKRRLHDTIKNLNRGLPPGTIRFRGDGTGQGVRWEYDCRRAAKSR